MQALLIALLAASAATPVHSSAAQETPAALPPGSASEVVPPWRRPAAPAAPAAPADPADPADERDSPAPKARAAPQWYRPRPSDAKLAWNESKVGVYDSWSAASRSVVLDLGWRTLGFAESSYEGPTGSTVRIGERELALSAKGVRARMGNVGVLLAQASGELETRAMSQSGPGAFIRYRNGTPLDFLVAELSVGTGSWVAFDLGEPDVQVGLAFPELFASLAWGQDEYDYTNGTETRHRQNSWLVPSIGARLVGLRATVLDIGFFELMLGGISYDWYSFSFEETGPSGPTTTPDGYPVASKLNISLAPALRGGIVF